MRYQSPRPSQRILRDTLQALAMAVERHCSSPSISQIPPRGISKNTRPTRSGKIQGTGHPPLTQDRSILIAVQQAARAGATTKEIGAITGLPTAVINGTAQFGAGGSKYLWRENV
jgi:hypothetical protein